MTTTDIGNAGARRAASLLGVAIGGEVRYSSMDEDAAKVDLHLTFRDALRPNELIPIRCQVKSGPSHARKGESTITLNIDQATKASLSGSGTPGLVAWVPSSHTDRIYWYASDPRNKQKTTAKISTNDFVRPSIRYDLSRLAIYSTWSHRHSCQSVRRADASRILSEAKQDYQRLKLSTCMHPLVGNLRISRFAWRHVTRRSKTAKQRNSALLATRYLHAFLDKVPDRFLCIRETPRQDGSRMTENRNITCWYRDALLIDGQRHTLVIRIIEIVTYPKNWQVRPVSINDVQQEATLASWWHTVQT